MWDWIWAHIPDPLRQTVVSVFSIFILSWIGRMMWHVSEVQKQNRRFWSLHLVWEVMVAVGMAFIADGVAHWLNLSGKPALAVIVVIAYLGPRGIQTLIVTGLERYKESGRKI